MIFQSMSDWFGLLWFVVLWAGYTIYARHKAKTAQSLSAVLYRFRLEWSQNMLRHDNRVVDIILLQNLSKMANFMASTTIFVIAGLITALYASDHVALLFEAQSFIKAMTTAEIQFKVLSLVLIFVFAFFRFTWCMRQHTFCSIMMGSAPYIPAERSLSEEDKKFAEYLAKISDRASHEFNYGLRAYYFALAFMTWFLNLYLFMLATFLVVIVLYRREFLSLSLKYLVIAHDARTKM